MVTPFLVHRLIARVIDDGASQYEGMMRCAERDIRPVHLMTCRAAAHQPALAEDLAGRRNTVEALP